jgi:hypothetical protein
MGCPPSLARPPDIPIYTWRSFSHASIKCCISGASNSPADSRTAIAHARTTARRIMSCRAFMTGEEPYRRPGTSDFRLAGEEAPGLTSQPQSPRSEGWLFRSLVLDDGLVKAGSGPNKKPRRSLTGASPAPASVSRRGSHLTPGPNQRGSGTNLTGYSANFA